MSSRRVTIEFRAFAQHDDDIITITLDLPSDDPQMLCERIFETTNTDGTVEPNLWQLISQQLPEQRTHTALSVGDRITIDDTTYECRRVGFTILAESYEINGTQPTQPR